MTSLSESLGERLNTIDQLALSDARTGVFSPSLVVGRIIFGSTKAALNFVGELWDKINPEYPSSTPESVLEQKAYEKFNEQHYGA